MSQRIPQTDPRLGPTYKRYACLYRSTLGIVEETAGRPFTIEELIELRDLHLRTGSVNGHMGLDKPFSYTTILADGFRLVGKTGGGNQVGLIDNGRIKYWDGRDEVWDFVLVNFAAHTPDGHWELADKAFDIIFNPDPDLETGRRRQIFLVRLWGGVT